MFVPHLHSTCKNILNDYRAQIHTKYYLMVILSIFCPLFIIQYYDIHGLTFNIYSIYIFIYTHTYYMLLYSLHTFITDVTDNIYFKRYNPQSPLHSCTLTLFKTIYCIYTIKRISFNAIKYCNSGSRRWY